MKLPRTDVPAELVTARLRLRPWRDDDRGPLAAINADPEVMAFFPSVLSRAASDASIDAWRAHFARHGWGPWAVEVLATRTLVGLVGMMPVGPELPFAPAVEIAWRLARPAWGKGYATEASRAALRFGFGTLRLPEVVAFTTLRNSRSRAVMERLGLRDLHRDFAHPGVPAGHSLRPHCLYRITGDEWAALPPPARRR